MNNVRFKFSVMTKHILTTVLSLISFLSASGQQSKNYFQPVEPQQISVDSRTRRGAFPVTFDTYRLDFGSIKQKLSEAPREFTPEADMGRCIVSIPVAGGALEDFSVFEVAQLDAEARAAFPDIHCYAGISTADPRRTIRFSTTVRGFTAMIMHPDFNTSFVEPYTWGQTEYYLAYHSDDAPDNGTRRLRAEVKNDGTLVFGEENEFYTPPVEDRGVELADPVKLKIFRFAVSCTGEFAQDHGTTKPEVFAAVTEYVNFISAIYERDIDLRFQLIAGSQNAIFLDPLTDPFTGQTVQDWLGQNTEILNLYCNPNSHDVGHVLARYITGGAIGVGALGVLCTPNKGQGCSAGVGVGNYGSSFIGVFGQELGHQLSGGHSWNNCGDNAQREGTEAFEPGSGSTIMSYAGACGADNIQGDADLYFHAGSINKIRNYYTFGATCGSYQETTNFAPVVTLPYQDNFFIPISTPFELNGSATDVDGDSLTYCWEQYDLGPPAPVSTPAGNCPLFRTRPAVNASNRYFPRLTTVINNAFDRTEQLPTYSRDMTFRLSVRDNRPNGGGLGHAQVAFNAFDGAGPFKVLSPNTNTTIWRVGEYAEVTWDVANTYAAPVNCKKVNIRLSTDGGQTYPVTLASGVENDGSQYVLVPNIISSSLRVRVDAADNIFYDISNQNFKIQAPVQPSLTLGLTNDAAEICLPGNFTTEIISAGVLGYSDPVQLEVTGNIPPGAAATFSSSNIQPGETATLSVDLSGITVEGEFTFNVRAVSGTQEYIRPIRLVLRRNDFSGFALISPADGLTGSTLTQTLRWGPGLDADLYDVQLATDPAFSNIVASRNASALDSFKMNLLLQKGTAYYWRVRPINECGAHAWSEPFFFSTFAEDCRIFQANDLPKNLSANSAPTIESKLTVNSGGVISDINIKTIDGYHSFFKDLEAHLISPAGTDVLLWKDRCGNFNGNFNFGLDDAAPGAFPCPPNNTGLQYRPVNPLTPFLGQNSTGEWTFRLKDNVIGSGGTLEDFQIEFCASVNVVAPFLVNNNIMPVSSGGNRVITPDFLLVEDNDNTHSELIYTVVTVPEDGIISRIGVGTLNPGDKFTQTNLDNGLIRFFDYGGSPAPDGFRFVVTDGKGGFLGTPKFLTQPFVGTTEEVTAELDFVIFPNPATDIIQLALGIAPDSDTQVLLTDMAGRTLYSGLMPAGNSARQIEVGELPGGIYLISVSNSAGRGVRKVIIR